MSQAIAGWGVSLLLFIVGVGIPSGKTLPQEKPVPPNSQINLVQVSIAKSIDKTEVEVVDRASKITFSWGNVSWLPGLATMAGWPQNTHARLAEIILRESGGCPNRRGGDAVDKQCNITHVTEWNHRSDTGLLQINGLNYDISRNKWAIACRKMNICTQEPLLNPLTNLRVGYLLYQEAGWAPWDPCAWGDEWAHRCGKNKKPKP